MIPRHVLNTVPQVVAGCPGRAGGIGTLALFYSTLPATLPPTLAGSSTVYISTDVVVSSPVSVSTNVVIGGNLALNAALTLSQVMLLLQNFACIEISVSEWTVSELTVTLLGAPKTFLVREH